jgi:hypothetical protein
MAWESSLVSEKQRVYVPPTAQGLATKSAFSLHNKSRIPVSVRCLVPKIYSDILSIDKENNNTDNSNNKQKDSPSSSSSSSSSYEVGLSLVMEGNERRSFSFLFTPQKLIKYQIPIRILYRSLWSPSSFSSSSSSSSLVQHKAQHKKHKHHQQQQQGEKEFDLLIEGECSGGVVDISPRELSLGAVQLLTSARKPLTLFNRSQTPLTFKIHIKSIAASSSSTTTTDQKTTTTSENRGLLICLPAFSVSCCC